MSKIKVSEHITMKQAVTPDEGAKIYDMIISYITSGDTPIELDFSDIDFMTTAFLNVAIGTLYKDYTGEKLNNLIRLQNISESHKIRIKQVLDNAKIFYADKDEFDKNVENALYAKD